MWRGYMMNIFKSTALFHFAVALFTFVCFPCSKEPPYFTAEPESVILAEVEKDVDILCQAMGECADLFKLG